MMLSWSFELVSGGDFGTEGLPRVIEGLCARPRDAFARRLATRLLSTGGSIVDSLGTVLTVGFGCEDLSPPVQCKLEIYEL